MPILLDCERVYPTIQTTAILIISANNNSNPLIFDRRPHRIGQGSIRQRRNQYGRPIHSHPVPIRNNNSNKCKSHNSIDDRRAIATHPRDTLPKTCTSVRDRPINLVGAGGTFRDYHPPTALTVRTGQGAFIPPLLLRHLVQKRRICSPELLGN